jgi:hypothetical protein
VGCNSTRIFEGEGGGVLVPCTAAEGQQGKAIDPPAGLPQPAVGALDYSSDSSIGSESGYVVEVTGPAAGGGSVSRRRHPVRKVGSPPLRV